MQAAITVQDLGKTYRSRDRGRPSSLKGRILSGYRALKVESFWGLRHISFSIARGRAVGVVGLNGAGKSTLLRLIGGVGVADEGSIRVNGRIGALLDIGAGLTEDLTGRENIFLLGVISGMLRSEVKERFDEIVAFAELADFIEAPVRTYSTGMRMRLAFAVAVNISPDILLIDEVLAVGDQAFQNKCLRRVDQIRKSGATIFLVSHDETQIRSLCDDVILLDKGRMIAHGPLDETMALYAASIDARIAATELPPPPPPRPNSGSDLLINDKNRFGTQKMVIDHVRVLDGQDRQIESIMAGEALAIALQFRGHPTDAPPVVLVGIYAADDSACFETNSQLAGIPLHFENGIGVISLRISRLDLAPGNYRLTVGLFSPEWETVYDYHAEVYPLRIIGLGPSKGYLNPPLNWQSSPAMMAGELD
ncbi:ABC transporter related protein [Sphingobium yanoikuyae]|uniref:ABC transporter related protein n=1 Tax=Sphingobium yanoikuyae TaxID=13690 RepID=A0A084EBF2_SPHYA|nr:ABC transporter ATP-binding protein [Sphingobium yanoikuyae]KEZ15294.1 ABC transporter related protein [Sphingobium yanoikuyae]